MNEKFKRFIAGQQFLVEPNWGLSEMERISAISEISGGFDISLFEKMKEQSQCIDYFSLSDLQSSSSEITSNSIAKVSFSGPMMLEDGWCSYGVKSFDRNMRSLYADKQVKAIIVDLNSGGGQATAGSLYYNTIKDKNKPVLTHYHLMASGSLLGSLHSDEIIAVGEMSQAGSIGVMMTIPKWYSDPKDERNDTNNIYSEDSKRKNEAWDALEKGDTSLLVKMLTDLDSKFMQTVRDNRRLKGRESTREETLSGAMFRATDAKKRGLIDGIGSFNYVLERAMSAISYSK